MTLGALRVVFLGAPGAGKGTQSDRILKDFALSHLSTGDALRAEIAASTPLGQRVKGILESGKLVDDRTVMAIVESAITKASHRGFILDGIPRTIGQAQALNGILERLHLPITHVPCLDITNAVLKERVCGRLYHPGSGRVYHRSFKPPRVAGKDDLTGEPLVTRVDDTEAAFEQRMKEYDATSGPLQDFYERKKLLYMIKGDDLSIDEVYTKLKTYLLKR